MHQVGGSTAGLGPQSHLAEVQDNRDLLGAIQSPDIVRLRRRDRKVVEQQPLVRWAAFGRCARRPTAVAVPLLTISSWC